MITKPKGYKKTGGRKKGTPNKITLDIIKALQELDFDPIKRLSKIVDNLSDKDQANVYLQLMDFVYPKRKPIDSAGDSDDNVNLYVYDTEFAEDPTPEAVPPSSGPASNS